MKTKNFKKRLPGMTLTELLVVLAILGILILLAYPVVTPLFQKAHSKEAQIQLKHLQNLEKAYFLEHAKYAEDLKSVGFEQALLAGQDENGTAHYRLEIVETAPNRFMARATSVTDFDGDGQMNVWEIGNEGPPREVTED